MIIERRADMPSVLEMEDTVPFAADD